MNLLNIIRSGFLQIFSFIFVMSYLMGILNVHFSDRKDFCVMTYMFEYPQFVRISVEENKEFPQYGLYAYSEGRFTERTRKMWFDGVPVLFLPGNSGSHMQARSLASVALRKALNDGYEFHFDYFTISYNEELSGLYGGVLESQTKFTAACISKILSLYKSNKFTMPVPQTVIVIGHSMGGVIAKRLLTYPDTMGAADIVITLAAPVQAPVLHFDRFMVDYYTQMKNEWFSYMQNHNYNSKVLINLGSGPRDVLVPSGLTSSNESSISALTTSIPGVWVSADHVSIVWCKQIVMTINKFLFSVVDPRTQQITGDKGFIMSKARQFFQANRSMTLSLDINRAEIPMSADAFWYEDNRRIYQISRPEIDRTTYLMIRLVKFHQNRFVAVEAVNVDDKDWIFACNAKFTYNTYRYCKQGTSLSELSRWTAAADDFGKRKLATVHLHSLMEHNPEWTHVVVKVSPTRKPIVLNVDVNDHASRQITVDVPSEYSFGKQVVISETESNSLYYELLLNGFNAIHQAYLLYVEPTANCKASQYHVSAEVFVPWAQNHGSFHYFTQAKRSPMKLRLFKSNPNITSGLYNSQSVKVTLLLDPQCTYTVSISTSWYLRLAQFARNYTPVLVAYVAAILLLAASEGVANLNNTGAFPSIHAALMADRVQPWYSLVCARLLCVIFMYVPFSSYLNTIMDQHGWDLEIEYFNRSLLVLPAYMTALGILHIGAAAVLMVMVFSSQLAHRLLFRIVWRGGHGLAERVATGLQRVPLVVSAALVCGVPLACGAASLAAGAAFYAFMLSKKYEEYLEDYVYKLMAKVAYRLRHIFKSKAKYEPEDSSLALKSIPEESNEDNVKAIEDKKEIDNKYTEKEDNEEQALIQTDRGKNETDAATDEMSKEESNKKETNRKNSCNNKDDSIVDDELNSLNFHMIMFFMWLVVTIVNMPVLLTWARNFKYNRVLRPDSSFVTGLVMSLCSSCLWQMDVPRNNLLNYVHVSHFLFLTGVFILVLGPQCLLYVNNFVMFVFVIMTLQQLLDRELSKSVTPPNTVDVVQETENTKSVSTESGLPTNDETSNTETNESRTTDTQRNDSQNECEGSSESKIYDVFKNLRDKFSFSEELS